MLDDNDANDCSDFKCRQSRTLKQPDPNKGIGMSQSKTNGGRKAALCAAALLGCFGLTGCAADYNGQSLPSPYYLSDDIQYFQAGPEFKLTREAAAQKEYRDTQAERQGPRP